MKSFFLSSGQSGEMNKLLVILVRAPDHVPCELECSSWAAAVLRPLCLITFLSYFLQACFSFLAAVLASEHADRDVAEFLSDEAELDLDSHTSSGHHGKSAGARYQSANGFIMPSTLHATA